VFETPLLTDPVELVGDSIALIYAASATTDVDVVAPLSVRLPNGKVMLLSEGVQRGRYRYDPTRLQAMTPGSPELFVVAFNPVAITLLDGRVLRVAISGTSYERYEPNPNVATPLRLRPTPVRTTLSLFMNKTLASFIYLTVKSGALP
jgi:predicted acyl esterase